MSLHDQENFIKEIHPFDKLTTHELDTAFKNMDIAYYQKDTVLISPDHTSDYFFIIIKGEVSEYNNDELTFVYHEQDEFDADSLIYNKTSSKFIVSEDLICYELKKKTFLELINTNSKFKNFFLKNLSSRLQTLKNKEYGSDISSFMFSKVGDIYLHEPCIVDKTCNIRNAIEKSIAKGTSTIIVENGTEYGVVTDSVLKKDVLLAHQNLELPIVEIAKFPFVCVQKDDFLFSVLLTLVKHSIKRVGVLEDGKITGLLKQADILSYFANHSHIVSVKIAKSATIEELRAASDDVNKTIKSLYDKSLKTGYIAKMVAELNAKVYEKLFNIVLPETLHDKCALLVMGSEGRDEQIIKTDQDNALVIEDGQDPSIYYPYMQEFTKQLISFGFPECEGNIMVSNPYWCKTQSEFMKQIDTWFLGTDMEHYMDLAIFFDAKCVAGDVSLFEPLKHEIFKLVKEKNVYMAYFANATLNFETPITLFSSLKTTKEGIDIKKGGIFAIVQGVRSLALENGVMENSTVARIKKLHKLNILEKDLASELIEALGLLSRLRLQGHILKLKEGKAINNMIDVSSFGKIERDMLKDSFSIVNTFKKFITHHFHLGNLH
ncbi:MAG: Predicted signal-transduction protein containing cAMP-binding and CBS domains [uncultured Sulfurovum sp.]|uniref:Predicted signal-transduction protein containing cAMP-binding and CBS domains n=1 Tax=uncultured Sulfurovum sp. TaxID=269237 RepID=A0A6S6UG43_9BACT|nr:MAG: Predicted signal-transduction protein containing cAMP-binding and CBS domains [uncultured Sulfurovum sp.]